MLEYPESDQSDVVHFELNNWACGKDYPDEEPFVSWMCNDLNIQFQDEKWVKENKLIVVESLWDMSLNYCITAKKQWVEDNCPSLLTKFKTFLRFPKDDSKRVYGQFECPFLPYEEENIGLWIAKETEDWQGYLDYVIEK